MKAVNLFLCICSMLSIEFSYAMKSPRQKKKLIHFVMWDSQNFTAVNRDVMAIVNNGSVEVYRMSRFHSIQRAQWPAEFEYNSTDRALVKRIDPSDCQEHKVTFSDGRRWKIWLKKNAGVSGRMLGTLMIQQDKIRRRRIVWSIAAE